MIYESPVLDDDYRLYGELHIAPTEKANEQDQAVY